MNSVTIWIFSASAFRIHGTPAAFTNEPRPYTTTLATRLRKSWFGRRYLADAGGLIGLGLIAPHSIKKVTVAYGE